METLPTEIAKLIYDGIHLADKPRLRLVSRFWNDIVTPYLLEEPKLVFKQDSFDRLLNISKHPYFSKRVISLIYEPNTLRPRDRYDWEKFLHIPYSPEDIPLPSGPNPTQRDMRVYHRTLAKAKGQKQPHSKKMLDDAWSVYKELFEEQQNLRGREYCTDEIREILQNFPNLREIHMNHGWGLWPGEGWVTGETKNLYARALASTDVDDWTSEPSGVPHMRSVLLAIDKAGIRLEMFRIGFVSWKFLTSEALPLDTIRRVFAPLKLLELQISTGIGSEEKPECRAFLDDTDSLHDILSIASSVRDLYISFDFHKPCAPANCKNFYQSTKWPFLTFMTLGGVAIEDKVWLAFLERHAQTLKHLTLDTIELSCGVWVDVMEKMQQSISFKSVHFGAHMRGIDPQQFWHLWPLDTIDGSSFEDMLSQANRTRVAIEDYFLHGGQCPLRDEESHPSSSAPDDCCLFEMF